MNAEHVDAVEDALRYVAVSEVGLKSGDRARPWAIDRGSVTALRLASCRTERNNAR